MVQVTLLLLLSSTIVLASFGPNVRIDHQNRPSYGCGHSMIAVGQGAASSQPLYVAFEGDTLPGGRCDIWFQKSLDGGRTWLAEDLLIKRGDRYAFRPDITTDSDGNVYIVFIDEFVDTVGVRDYHVSCVRSSDGGATWSAPARVNDSAGTIGGVRIAAGSAGNLFCAWNDWRTGSGHIWSSVSTDQGATWSQNVRVDDDTTDYNCYQPDVFVQPGSDQYLVVAEVPRPFEAKPHIRPCAYLYCSTDRGQTFQPGIQLDTFNSFASTPHVVADRDHIIRDYTGAGKSFYGHQNFTESRTFYSGPDTWGTPCPVTSLDSLHYLHYSGALALSADGRVHTALMICDRSDSRYDVFYAFSSDHGVPWSDIELVNEDTTGGNWNPDIGADMEGHAYVVWTQGAKIWFSTNSPAAITEQPTQPTGRTKAHVITDHDGIEVEYQLSAATHVRATLHDAVGRQVGLLDMGLQQPGTHRLSWNQDRGGRKLAAGAYFVLLDMGSEKSTLKAVIR
jgi:hypothetical protein